MKLLLASRSEARRRMLEAAGVPFESASADLDEEIAKEELRNEDLSAPELAQTLAERKSLSLKVDALVLGSDQTLETVDGRMLDKPGSPQEAWEQLRYLRGRTHRLHSAAAVSDNEDIVWRGIESVSLTMRHFSDRFLEDYLAREYEAIRWSVGGYHIERRGVQLFERIEGSHFAVQGLPLLPLLAFLRERGILAS